VSTGKYVPATCRSVVLSSAGSGEALGLLSPEAGDKMLIRNISNQLPAETAYHSRRIDLQRHPCDNLKSRTYTHTSSPVLLLAALSSVTLN
jgi:hypothetical protein